jgi:hypothetical protein
MEAEVSGLEAEQDCSDSKKKSLQTSRRQSRKPASAQ